MAINFRPNDAVNPGVNEQHVMKLAETTEVSPEQAREILKKHNGDLRKARKEAGDFKAES